MQTRDTKSPIEFVKFRPLPCRKDDINSRYFNETNNISLLDVTNKTGNIVFSMGSDLYFMSEGKLEQFFAKGRNDISFQEFDVSADEGPSVILGIKISPCERYIAVGFTDNIIIMDIIGLKKEDSPAAVTNIEMPGTDSMLYFEWAPLTDLFFEHPHLLYIDSTNHINVFYIKEEHGRKSRNLEVHCACFSFDGRYVLAIDQDERKLYVLDPRDLSKITCHKLELLDHLYPMQITHFDPNVLVIASIYRSRDCKHIKSGEAVILVVEGGNWATKNNDLKYKMQDYKLHKSADFTDADDNYVPPEFRIIYVPERELLLVGHCHSLYIDYFYKDRGNFTQAKVPIDATSVVRTTKIRGFSLFRAPFSPKYLNEPFQISLDGKTTGIAHPPALIILDSEGQLFHFYYIDKRFTSPGDSLLEQVMSPDYFKNHYVPTIKHYISNENGNGNELPKKNNITPSRDPCLGMVRQEETQMRNADTEPLNKSQGVRQDGQQTLDKFMGPGGFKNTRQTLGFRPPSFGNNNTQPNLSMSNASSSGKNVFLESGGSSGRMNPASNAFLNSQTTVSGRPYLQLKGTTASIARQNQTSSNFGLNSSNNNNNQPPAGQGIFNLRSSSTNTEVSNSNNNSVNQPNQMTPRDALTTRSLGGFLVNEPSNSFLQQPSVQKGPANVFLSTSSQPQPQKTFLRSGTSEVQFNSNSLNTQSNNNNIQPVNNQAIRPIMNNVMSPQPKLNIYTEQNMQQYMPSPKHIIRANDIKNIDMHDPICDLQLEHQRELKIQGQKIEARIHQLFFMFEQTKLPLASNYHMFKEDEIKPTNTVEADYQNIKISQKVFNANTIMYKESMSALKDSYNKQKNFIQTFKEQLSLPLEDANFVDHRVQHKLKQDLRDDEEQALKELRKVLTEVEAEDGVVLTKFNLVDKFFHDMDRLKQVHPHTKARKLPRTVPKRNLDDESSGSQIEIQHEIDTNRDLRQSFQRHVSRTERQPGSSDQVTISREQTGKMSDMFIALLEKSDTSLKFAEEHLQKLRRKNLKINRPRNCIAFDDFSSDEEDVLTDVLDSSQKSMSEHERPFFALTVEVRDRIMSELRVELLKTKTPVLAPIEDNPIYLLEQEAEKIYEPKIKSIVEQARSAGSQGTKLRIDKKIEQEREEQKRKERERELALQRERELQKQREAELEKQRQLEIQRQKELELKKAQEEALRKKAEDEARRKREEEEKAATATAATAQSQQAQQNQQPTTEPSSNNQAQPQAQGQASQQSSSIGGLSLGQQAAPTQAQGEKKEYIKVYCLGYPSTVEKDVKDGFQQNGVNVFGVKAVKNGMVLFFKDMDSAQKAIALNGKQINGATIQTQLLQSQPTQPSASGAVPQATSSQPATQPAGGIDIFSTITKGAINPLQQQRMMAQQNQASSGGSITAFGSAGGSSLGGGGMMSSTLGSTINQQSSTTGLSGAGGGVQFGKSAFGQTSAPGTSVGFGQTSAPGTGLGFGQTSAPGTSLGFGQTSAPGTGLGFGQTSAPGTSLGFGSGMSQQQPSQGSLGFGATVNKPVFGSSTFGSMGGGSGQNAGGSSFAQISQTGTNAFGGGMNSTVGQQGGAGIGSGGLFGGMSGGSGGGLGGAGAGGMFAARK